MATNHIMIDLETMGARPGSAILSIGAVRFDPSGAPPANPADGLTGADLRDANLFGANLTGADLTGANLAGANLRDATLTGTSLGAAILIGTILAGADLRGADLGGAMLRAADLDGAILPDGSTTETYDPRPLFTEGRAVPADAWTCHKWHNCPLHYAFDAADVPDLPPHLQPAAWLWLALYDGRHPCALRGLVP